MTLPCSNCRSDLISSHVLEDHSILPMSNKSRMIYPKCSVCGYPVRLRDVSGNIADGKKVLLITGTAGAGKTTIGQLIEKNSSYIFIDGDAVQKRVHHIVRMNPDIRADCQEETLSTMLILLALGYDAAVGYIINKDTFKIYSDRLSEYGITPVLRVLVPGRSVCLERDALRECWTAGEKWVDEWYEEMRSYTTTHPSLCIDTSDETPEETFALHFAHLL